MKEFINDSEVKIFSKNMKVRIHKSLITNYDKGLYYNALMNLQKCFDLINSLNIKYSGNANPILYIYIIPLSESASLINLPNGGGRGIPSYDLEGFKYAYVVSENVLENEKENINITQLENNIHELAHLIHGEFFFKNQTIC